VAATARFVYDEVPYDTEANAETHPSCMATLARMCGRSPASPRTARVLEIGCGNGENLIAAATWLPEARFVGFDLASRAIATGAATASTSGVSNVELFVADIRDVRRRGLPGLDPGSFDYVVAHGIYSWVPEDVRPDLLGILRAALAPGGVGFVSVNALPGWELRRALRELAMDATKGLDDPTAKVAEALRLVAEIGRAGEGAGGFFGALSAAAREYEAHVTRATPPEAPYSRYVFHDLLAECNDPFSVTELERRLAEAGLRVVCETPLRAARATAVFEGLAADMARTGTPFLQVLVERDDAAPPGHAAPRVEPDLFFWADLTPAPGGGYKTTTGALVRPVGESGLARAVAHAPGFVRVRDLDDDDDARGRLARQLFEGFCEGVFTLTIEPPSCASSLGDRPRTAGHIRARAADAVERRAASAVVTNALHRSFRLPWSELVVMRALDGARTVDAIVAAATAEARSAPAFLAGPLAASARDAERHVTTVLDRLRRHLFLLEERP
jgi:SAM-dependent methyltransferase